MSKIASKVLTGALAFILFATTAFANPQMGISRVGVPEVHKNIVHLNEVHPTALEQLQAMGGLTFYKDFTKIPAGTYSDAGLLNADYSIGSPVSTFTSTSGSFTITSNGYQATTANDEVLKYLIAGNRTAEQETIVIKFTPSTTFSSDGVFRDLLGSSTKNRIIQKFSTESIFHFLPNSTDSTTCDVSTSITPQQNVSYIIVAVASSSTPYATVYYNGALNGTPDTDRFTANLWGIDFFIGSNNTSNQLDGVVASVAFFNRALSKSEILSLNGLM